MSSLYEILKRDVTKMVNSVGKYQSSNLYSLIVKQVEEDLINLVLQETNNNLFRTAQVLGISRNTLYRKIKEFKIKV